MGCEMIEVTINKIKDYVQRKGDFGESFWWSIVTEWDCFLFEIKKPFFIRAEFLAIENGVTLAYNSFH